MKQEFNIIYAPQTGPKHVIYEDDKYKIWQERKRVSQMPNVGMSFYSMKTAVPQDSMYVIEPRCVHSQDYDKRFIQKKKVKFIFTWASKAFQDPFLKNKVVELNHPSCLYPPKIETLEKTWSTPWKDRNMEIVFIANNKSSSHESELYSLRVQLADELHKHFKVKWYGQIPIKKPYYAGKIESKNQALGKAKFTICTENCYDSKFSYNYFTEKMPDAWFNGSVPIYMGCFNVDELGFDTQSYIDLRPIVNKSGKKHDVKFDALIKRIKEFNSTDYEKTRNAFFENIRKPNGLYHVISYDRVYKTMAQHIFSHK